ncbi:MAG TPA: peptidoglycan bridge formation glycyltransferase FemA/FemB family protein [Oscillospiraceae bacterium]|nr:peptidoglycan bridge formation glycyltransferase FemA/FemB family protein [Oscillospiraceae bacterium]
MQTRIVDHDGAELYDEFLAKSAYGDMLQTFSWGEIKKTDWEAVRAVVEDDNQQICAAMSILLRRIPLINRTIAYVPRGPILADTTDSQLIHYTLEALTTLARQHGAIVIKIDPAIPEGLLSPQDLQDNGFHLTGTDHEFGGTQPRYTFRLPLTGSEDEIFARFTKKMRYKIRYGPKNGLSFRSNEETSIADFYTALSQTGERNDIMTRSPEYFQRVYDELKKDDRVLLCTGYIEGEPVISSLTFALGDKAWAVYGGQTNKYRKLYTYHAMNWERIKWAHRKGAVWFDFYGVPGNVEEDHPLFGLYQFKQSFGGDYLAFIGEWDKPLSPAFYWLWQTGLPRYRSLLHRLFRHQ